MRETPTCSQTLPQMLTQMAAVQAASLRVRACSWKRLMNYISHETLMWHFGAKGPQPEKRFFHFGSALDNVDVCDYE